MWQLPWSIKKQIYGAENLIAVGGKADDEGLEEAGGQAKAEKTRNSNTRSPEPVFHHNLPPMFTKTSSRPSGSLRWSTARRATGPSR